MDTEIIAEGQYRRFVRKNGWEYIERVTCNKVVVMIALTDDHKVIFVEQLRIPVGAQVIEFPAGLVNDREDNRSESLIDTARRELIEETGYSGLHFELIREEPANAALTTDMLYVYFVRGLTKVGPGGGDETENIRTHEIPLGEVDDWLKQQKRTGKMIDLKTYAGLYYLKNKAAFAM